VSSTEYAKCIYVFFNNLTWAEQVELSKLQGPALSYVFPKVGEMETANQANTIESTSVPYNTIFNDMCTSQSAVLQSTNVNMYESQGLELSAIHYTDNQLVNLQLWDSSFCHISIFSINNYLEEDAKNIVCLLY